MRVPPLAVLPALAGLVALLAAAGSARGEEPWSVADDWPVLDEPAVAAPVAPSVLPSAGLALDATDPLTLVAEASIWGYQHVLSPVDGPTCSFYPTCSGYGMDALHAHGWLLGSAMAVERILRNHLARGVYPLVRVHGVVRMLDPVSDNDFWFRDAAE